MFGRSQENGKKIESVSQGRRHLLKRGGILAGIAAFVSAFSITPFAPVHAKTQSQPGVLQYIPLSASDAKAYLDVTFASTNYQAFKNQIQSTYTGVFTLQEQKASAFRVKTAQTTFVQVIIPLSGGAGPHFPSFYTAIFRSDPHTISSEYSGLMTQKSAQTIHIAIKGYPAGLVVDADRDVTSGALQGSVQTSQGIVQLKNVAPNSSAAPADLGSWLNCLNNCVSARGGNTGLIQVAITLCSTVCIQYPTPICPVCDGLLSPVVGILTAEAVSYCLGYCS